jgi:hypothetical protein
LVKTTPKPRATKKRSGELLELPVPPLAWVAVAVGLADWAVEFAGGVAEGDAIVEFMIDGERRRARRASKAELNGVAESSGGWRRRSGAQAKVKQTATATATDPKTQKGRRCNRTTAG